MRRKISLLITIAVFLGTYLIAYPFLLAGITHPALHRYVHVIERWIAYAMLASGGNQIQKRYTVPLGKQAYVFCANHTSLLDVASLLLHHQALVFVGKSAISKVPLFGYIYRHVHITVNRANNRSKHQVILQSKQTIQQGNSVVFFPEGGITSRHPPKLGAFKVGAFRLAIEAQVPIVPVTIFNSWTIFPKYPNNKSYYTPKIELLFHHPIPTQGLNLSHAQTLADQTKTCIHQSLVKRFPTIFN